MAFSQQLKAHFQPKIKLIQLSDLDTSAESSSESIVKKNKNLPDSSQKAGVNKPFIKLAGQIVVNIEHLIIDETGFIPKLELMFTDNSGEFSGNYFPKRNLMISVYIASPNPNFKPVRSDYLITNVKSIPIHGDQFRQTLTKGTTFIIKAELFVPRLYNNISKSYSSLSSSDTLKRVSQDLGLGYAQNEFTTSDRMTWININTSPSNFIKEVASYSYQDDDSFFSTFISKEMMLTMVNVNEQLKSLDIDKTFTSISDVYKFNISQKQKQDSQIDQISETVIDNYLSNIPMEANKPNYIYEASLVSNQGEILKKDGYKKEIYYYDHLEGNESKKIKSFYMAPINTEGLSENTMLIPDDEGLAEVGHKKWMNINYGNTHENWNAAKLINTLNNKELEKLQLKVLLKGTNFQVIKGSSVPVLMTLKIADAITKETPADGSYNPNAQNKELNELTIDSQLSGRYYVKGAKYYYSPTDPFIFSTELFLARREWLPSKITFTANA
jgi:hypothetical protein